MTNETDVEQITDAAAAILRRCGVSAESEQTGGGTYCIVISGVDEPRFWFGTADTVWAAQVADDARGLRTDVLANEQDPGRVAQGILRALADYSTRVS